MLDQFYLKLRSIQHGSRSFQSSNIIQFLVSKRGIYAVAALLLTVLLYLTSKHPARITTVKPDELHGTALGYRSIIEKYNVDLYGSQTSLNSKCSFYFKSLQKNDPEWRLDELDIEDKETDHSIFVSKERFIEKKRAEFRKKFGNMSPDQFEALIKAKNKEKQWETQYEKTKGRVIGTEQEVVDSLTNLNVFGKCYLDSATSKKEQLKIDTMGEGITCSENEKRLFSYLTRQLPIYTRWDGEQTSDSLPVMENIDDSLTDEKTIDGSPLVEADLKESCFTRYLKNSYNGKGIALTLTSEDYDYHLQGLLMTLRALGSTLPVQIFHYGELDSELKESLIHISRAMNLNFENSPSYKLIRLGKASNVPRISSEGGLPPLDLWFVNLEPAINKESSFAKPESLKLLTYLFSSFKDTIMMDLDTVPLIDLDKHLLQSRGYSNLGAYLFKDRELSEPLTSPQLRFLDKLLPSFYDEKLFGIKEPTVKTFTNRVYGDGFKSYQSSGLFAVNKQRHFNTVLASLSLNLWDHVTATLTQPNHLHQTKELIWLGFVLSGTESFHMNAHPAGMVGEINSKINRLPSEDDDAERRNLKSTELCSAHVGHLSDQDSRTLVWVNYGMTYCEWYNPIAIDKDYQLDLHRKVIKSKDDLKTKYKDILPIKALLIPPPQERMVNDPGFEPNSGFINIGGCHGKLWCAYDRVGGLEDPFYEGKTVAFDTEEMVGFHFLGEVWTGVHDIVGSPR